MRGPVRIGLTGGLASGKSTVAGWLAEAGLVVVDADRLVAELYAPGGEGARVVAEMFGRDYLEPGGAVDRARLAARVFSDPDARKRLEAAVHPLVRRRFAAIAEAAPRPAVLEATLLVEAGYAPDFDLVVTVEAEPELRLCRAVARGLDPAQARARLDAQGAGRARRAAAHRTLQNEGSLHALRRQVDDLLGGIEALAAREGGRGRGRAAPEAGPPATSRPATSRPATAPPGARARSGRGGRSRP